MISLGDFPGWECSEPSPVLWTHLALALLSSQPCSPAWAQYSVQLTHCIHTHLQTSDRQEENEEKQHWAMKVKDKFKSVKDWSAPPNCCTQYPSWTTLTELFFPLPRQESTFRLMVSFKINTLWVSSHGRIPTPILKVNLNILGYLNCCRIVLQSTAPQQTHQGSLKIIVVLTEWWSPLR